MDTHVVSQLAWERMVTAVEKVRERLRRAAKALEDGQIPYAVVGGNAVAAWVSEMDEAAVRNTRDVDILLRRADWPKAVAAMEAAGFVSRHAAFPAAGFLHAARDGSLVCDRPAEELLRRPRRS